MYKDIDSDFSPIKGSAVFDHLNQLYGKENCCNILTFTNEQARMIIKDVCRCFEVPLAEVNAVCKMIPNDVKKFKDVLETKEVKEFFDKYQGIYQHCEKIYGSPKSTSQHPAGIAVLPFPATDIMPVCNAKATAEGNVWQTSQFEKEQCESIGAISIKIHGSTKCGNCWKPLKFTKLQHNLKQITVNA